MFFKCLVLGLAAYTMADTYQLRTPFLTAACVAYLAYFIASPFEEYSKHVANSFTLLSLIHKEGEQDGKPKQ